MEKTDFLKILSLPVILTLVMAINTFNKKIKVMVVLVVAAVVTNSLLSLVLIYYIIKG